MGEKHTLGLAVAPTYADWRTKRLPNVVGPVDSYVADVVGRIRAQRKRLGLDAPLLLVARDETYQVEPRCDPKDANRMRFKRKNGVPQKGFNQKMLTEQNEVMAAAAERLVADTLGRRFDDSIHLDGDRCDIWMGGRSIDVKWSPRLDARLILTPRDPDDPLSAIQHDIYVLVVGATERALRIVGWSARSDRDRFERRGFGFGGRIYLEQDELRPLKALAALSGEPKPGELLGTPWRIALALQADGWWLRDAVPFDCRGGGGFAFRFAGNGGTFRRPLSGCSLPSSDLVDAVAELLRRAAPTHTEVVDLFPESPLPEQAIFLANCDYAAGEAGCAT